jgi:predicted metal-dependent phosphoesterase TrpH
VIDLHLHTSASDGLLSPAELVDRVAAAGVSTCSVTDHDTVAGLDAAAAASAARGLRFLPGIEITAVADGRDVHMLGYGFDPASAPLASFLIAQREERRLRVQRLFGRLAALDMPVDEAQVLAAAHGRVIGRPHVARAMVAAGYVATVTEAFERWLGSGQPAFVPRSGAAPEEVVALVQRAGGLAAMAHPGLTKRDALIPGLVAAGLDAIEVWHSEHDDRETARYRALAAEHGLLMTGGSDFHGDLADRVCRLGAIGVPDDAFDALMARLSARRAAADAAVVAPALLPGAHPR